MVDRRPVIAVSIRLHEFPTMANIVHRDSIYRPTDRLLYKYWALRMRDISATAKRALVVVATICAVYAAAPALNLGFVSDDYIHLSVDRNKPWYFSSDHLYRPLRSGFFKLMAASFGLEPQPYRVLTRLGRDTEAEAQLTAAVDTIESIAAKLITPQLRRSFLAAERVVGVFQTLGRTAPRSG